MPTAFSKVLRNTTNKKTTLRSFQFVDKLIDKLLRAVEKDADFVFRLSSAYKGTPESLKAKSTKSPDKSGDFCCIARLLIDSAFAVTPTLFAIVAFSFFAVCAFFDSLRLPRIGSLLSAYGAFLITSNSFDNSKQGNVFRSGERRIVFNYLGSRSNCRLNERAVRKSR